MNEKEFFLDLLMKKKAEMKMLDTSSIVVEKSARTK